MSLRVKTDKTRYTHIQTIKKQLILKVAHNNIYKLIKEKKLEINISKLQQQLREFAEVREWEQFHSPKNLACALSVEASELLEHFQWMKEEESRTLPRDKLIEVETEIADIFCYLLMISDKLGINLIESTSKKIESNKSRYPINKSKGRSDKYTKL